MRWAVLAISSACGRIGFDTAPDMGDLDDGLLVDLEFGSDVLYDSGPYHFSVDCVSSCPTPTPGRMGDGAAAFASAGSQCVSIADAPALQPTTLSIALWTDATATAGGASIFARPLEPAGNADTFALLVDYALESYGAYVGTTMLSARYEDGWNHFALTFDGTTALVYVNGQPRGSQPAVLAYGDAPLLFGCDENNGTPLGFFDGDLADVRVYGRALDAMEIAALAAR